MAEAAGESVRQGAFIADRHRMEPVVTSKPASNYMAAGICAIIALIVYGLLVALQWMDFKAYQFQ